jgi:hypothetical protein
MRYLTPYEIAETALAYEGRRNRAAINKHFRRQNQSHLYPVNGRFDATERAIRRIRRLERDGLCLGDGLEYALALDAEISAIVNAL